MSFQSEMYDPELFDFEFETIFADHRGGPHPAGGGPAVGRVQTEPRVHPAGRRRCTWGNGVHAAVPGAGAAGG